MSPQAGRKGFLHFARSPDNRNLTEIIELLYALTLPGAILTFRTGRRG